MSTYATIYRDFDMSMNVASDTKDLVPLVDRDCIRASIFRIISLSKLDIPFNVAAYSKLKELLFEFPDQTSDIAIKTNLEWIIAELEPRVKVDSVEITHDEEKETCIIDIYYTILRTNTQDIVRKEVERVR